jgi:hypothetical protein
MRIALSPPRITAHKRICGCNHHEPNNRESDEVPCNPSHDRVDLWCGGLAAECDDFAHAKRLVVFLKIGMLRFRQK